jgi:hypothetical protein
MHGYRIFRLHASQTATDPALWADLGSVELDLATDPAGVVGERFGPGEYLVVDEQLTVVDFEVP